MPPEDGPNNNLKYVNFHENLKAADHIWLHDEEHCWVAAKILEITSSGKLNIEIESTGNIKQISLDEAKTNILPRNNSLCEDRIDDLTGLSFLHEASVLNTIRSRYSEESVYTYSGIVLASVNPYCNLPIYEKEIIQAYNLNRREELAPHLFAVAQDAFRSLTNNRKNQSIIVSGESGAGKTISAKYIMRYFAEACIAGTPNLSLLNDQEGDATTVEDRVLATNPILEAFGNAKTIRNDNSSRFGKFVQIFFNKNNAIVGAAIKTYLLEKTRVIGQAQDERNFHIFYQLLKGCPENERKELFLDLSTDYRYVPDKNIPIDDVDDVDEFGITRESMRICGFSESQQWKIFRIIASILHLGNVEFEDDSDGHSHVVPSSEKFLEITAKLLSVDISKFRHSLLRRNIVAGGETIDAYNNKLQSQTARDSIAKHLYSLTFSHIAKVLNSQLYPKNEGNLFIGVLDIYGFEKFNVNSFEQLCINYANEKLQNQFNKHVFQIEQEIYDREGIDWSYVKFSDNQKCIDLIESKMGVLDLLDEECRFPNGSDQSFVSKLYEKNSSEEFLLQDKFSQSDFFIIKHFAYDVQYSSSGFLDKNRDNVSQDLLKVLNESTFDFLGSILATSPGIDIDMQQTSKKQTRISTGIAFKQSLMELMDILVSTKTHYVRCIKPNQRKEALYFDSPFVLQQLRACGILETVRISADGYPGRWTFSEFINRFRILAKDPHDLMLPDIDAQSACMALIDQFNMSKGEIQVGKTMVFMRSGVLAAFEEARTSKLHLSARGIQTIARFTISKQFITRVRSSIKVIQRYTGVYKGRLRFRRLLTLFITNQLITYFLRFKAICLLAQAKESINLVLGHFKRRGALALCRSLEKHNSLSIIGNGLLCMIERRLYKSQVYIGWALSSRYKIKTSWTTLLKLREEAKSVEHLKETSYQLEIKIMELSKKLKAAEDQLLIEKEDHQTTKKLLEAQAHTAKEDAQPLEHKEGIINSKELEAAMSKISSLERILDSMELANKDLFDRNEQLTLQVQELRRSKVQGHQMSDLIVRELKPVGIRKHLRSVSFDSNLDRISELTIPGPRMINPLSTTANSETDIKVYLNDANCLAELLQIIDTARIPRTAEERASKNASRLPAHIFERWILSWLRVESNSQLVKSYMTQILDRIKACCITDQRQSGRRSRHNTDPIYSRNDYISMDRRVSYWIANLFDFLCFLQWSLSEYNDISSNGDNSLVGYSPEVKDLSETLLVLMQLRTDVARIVEELYRTWLTELFWYFSRLAVAGVIEYQGLSGFAIEEPVKTSQIKVMLMPFAKLASGASDNQFSNATIEDLVFALEELADSMEACHLQSEIVTQVISSVVSNFCSSAFNQLLLRKNFASWKRGIQIQYNISRLEEWASTLNSKNPNYFFPEPSSSLPSPILRSGMAASTTSPLRQLEPLIQAVKLLQLAKTIVPTELEVLVEACPRLNLSQIRKILSVYVPDIYEDGPVAPEIIRDLTLRIQKLQREKKCPITETIPELQAHVLPLQLSIRPIQPLSFSEIPTVLVPPHLWKIFALIDASAGAKSGTV